jgi:hypothetical protein
MRWLDFDLPIKLRHLSNGDAIGLLSGSSCCVFVALRRARTIWCARADVDNFAQTSIHLSHNVYYG